MPYQWYLASCCYQKKEAQCMMVKSFQYHFHYYNSNGVVQCHL